MEAHPDGSAAGQGQQAGDAGKQLAVDDHIDGHAPHRDEGFDKINGKTKQADVVDGQNPVRGQGPGQFQHLAVFKKYQCG